MSTWRCFLLLLAIWSCKARIISQPTLDTAAQAVATHAVEPPNIDISASATQSTSANGADRVVDGISRRAGPIVSVPASPAPAGGAAPSLAQEPAPAGGPPAAASLLPAAALAAKSKPQMPAAGTSASAHVPATTSTPGTPAGAASPAPPAFAVATPVASSPTSADPAPQAAPVINNVTVEPLNTTSTTGMPQAPGHPVPTVSHFKKGMVALERDMKGALRACSIAQFLPIYSTRKHRVLCEDLPAVMSTATASSSKVGTSLDGSEFVPGACGSVPTSLGYQCSWAAPHGVVLHWSYNLASPPINRCTTNNAVPNAEAQNNMTWLGDAGVHFAIQAAAKDKLHLAFVGPEHRYYPSEGIHSGTYCRGAECSAKIPQVEIKYHRSAGSSEVAGNRALRDPNLMEGWAAWASADFDELTGVLCFSRRAESKQMRVGANISNEATMSYAVNSKTPYTHRAPRLGIVRIDFKTGTAALVKLPHRAMKIHGVLMLLAFAVLLPAGLLTSRHSWLFVDNRQVSGLTPAWTLVHMGMIALGALLGLAGMLVALVSLGSSGPGAMSMAHQVVGISVTGLSLLLAAMYILRPLIHTSPGSVNPLLGVLKLLNTLTITGGWTALFTGCIVARDNWAIPLDNWMPLCAITCGLVTMIAIALELRYQKLVRYGAYNPKTHFLSNSNPLPLARVRTHREPIDPKKEPLLSPSKAGFNDTSSPAGSPGGKSPQYLGGYTRGPLPVHVLAAADDCSSLSSGNSTPSSVIYRARSRTISHNGVDSGFPSHVDTRGHM